LACALSATMSARSAGSWRCAQTSANSVVIDIERVSPRSSDSITWQLRKDLESPKLPRPRIAKSADRDAEKCQISNASVFKLRKSPNRRSHPARNLTAPAVKHLPLEYRF